MKYRITIPRLGPWIRRVGKWRELLPSAPRGRLGALAGVALWLMGGGALVSLVFGLSFYTAMRVEMSASEVAVPDLAGRTMEAAAEIVAPLDLVLAVVDQRHDPAVASGRILQQKPPSGSPVRRGRKVKLILSLGGKVLVVPDLVGQASRTVAIELRQAGFAPGDEARVSSAQAASGSVMAQVPPPETPAIPNTRIHRLVSEGAATATWVMPDLIGLSRERAESWIGRSAFRRGTVRRVSMNGRTSGEVIGQLPLAGYPVRAKDVIELTVAR
jgi:beta-lactam-binding protein with PASTA domain